MAAPDRVGARSEYKAARQPGGKVFSYIVKDTPFKDTDSLMSGQGDNIKPCGNQIDLNSNQPFRSMFFLNLFDFFIDCSVSLYVDFI